MKSFEKKSKLFHYFVKKHLKNSFSLINVNRDKLKIDYFINKSKEKSFNNFLKNKINQNPKISKFYFNRILKKNSKQLQNQSINFKFF